MRTSDNQSAFHVDVSRDEGFTTSRRSESGEASHPQDSCGCEASPLPELEPDALQCQARVGLTCTALLVPQQLAAFLSVVQRQPWNRSLLPAAKSSPAHKIDALEQI